MNFRSILTSTASAAAIVISGATALSAQETQQSQRVAGLEEITVTARRVEENIQRVPISVTALSADTLADRGITDLNLLQQVVPAFNKALNSRGGFAWIRGLEGIASYFADAPFPLGNFGQNFDTGSFQVLKGPQGTLFGQSSAAGAIVVNPVKPRNEFEGYIKATLGSYGLRNIQGAINYPIVDDKLLLRVASDSYYRAGYVKNLDTGKAYADENNFTLRPSLTWRVNDSIENYTMLSYFYQRINGRPNFFTNYAPNGLWARSVSVLNRNGDTPDDIVGRYLDSQMGKYKVINVDEQKGFSGIKDKVLFVVNETNWDVTDNIALKNIFSYNSFGSRSRTDAAGDGFLFNAINFDQAVQESQSGLLYTKIWSDELKVVSQWWEDRINLTVGTFHTATEYPYAYSLTNTAFVPAANITRGVVRTPVRSRAVYAQANTDLSDKVLEGLSFTLGYRTTWDKTKQDRWRLRANLAIPLKDWSVVDYLSQEAHFSYSNWLVGLQYQYTPETMFYLTGAKGVTNGSVNLDTPIGFRVTRPETLTQLEGGFKSTVTVGDMQVRSNVSAYYGIYKDIQVTVIRQAQVQAPPAPPQNISISENAAEGRVRGVDFDVTVVPTEWLELSLAGAFNANKYTSWQTIDAAGNPVDRSDSRYLGNPKMKYNIGATVYLPIDPELGQLSFRADWQHQSRAWYDGTQTRNNQVPFTVRTAAAGYGPNYLTGEAVGADSVMPHGTLDVSMTWDTLAGIDGLKGVATVTNVLKETEIISGGYAWHAVGAVFGSARPPRMFTVGLNYSF